MTPGTGLYVSTDQHRPVAEPKIDARSFGSSPKLKCFKIRRQIQSEIKLGSNNQCYNEVMVTINTIFIIFGPKWLRHYGNLWGYNEQY